MSSIKFGRTEARKLVDLLGSDDDFRERFSADPIAALEQAGLMPGGDAGASIRASARCLMVSELASKDAILGARAEIDRMLLSGGNQTVPMLDAGLAKRSILKAAA